MKILTQDNIKSFCDIIHNEPDQRIKNKLSAWADQYVNNTDTNVDFGFLSGIASQSSLKKEIELWISSLIGTSSVTIPETITETVAETPQTVSIDAEPEQQKAEEVVQEIPETKTEESVIKKPKRKRKSL